MLSLMSRRLRVFFELHYGEIEIVIGHEFIIDWCYVVDLISVAVDLSFLDENAEIHLACSGPILICFFWPFFLDRLYPILLRVLDWYFSRTSPEPTASRNTICCDFFYRATLSWKATVV